MPRIMSLSWGLLRMRQHLAPSAGGHMLIYRQLRDWHLAFLSPIKMANIYYCLAKKVPFFISTSNPSSQCVWKSQKKSHSTLHLHFEWTKVHLKCQKWFILAIFWKPEACSQAMLPDRSVLLSQKLVKNVQFENLGLFESFLNNVRLVFVSEKLCNSRWMSRMSDWSKRGQEELLQHCINAVKDSINS